MILNLFILLLSLAVVIGGAIISTKYSAKLADSFNLSRYVIGFVVVAVISILPETFIAINSAIEGNPAFGLGTLFGSNVADLTLVFSVIVLLSNRRDIKIESKIIKNNSIYPFIFLIPIILGLDGYYSRIEGFVLILVGALFYYLTFKNSSIKKIKSKKGGKYSNLLLLLGGIFLLLVGSHFTVLSASDLALNLKVNPILIGMLIVGLGTTIPELLFSLQSARKHYDSLAVGDVLGTVLADATVVVGLVAIIAPFQFPLRIIYITAVFMLVAAFLLAYFMKTKKNLSHFEAYLLLLFWLLFAICEFVLNR